MTTSLFVCFFLLPLHIQLPWLLYLLLLSKTDNFIGGFGFMACNAIFNIISVIIVAVSFIGGGNWSTQIKPPTSCKSLTNFIT